MKAQWGLCLWTDRIINQLPWESKRVYILQKHFQRSQLSQIKPHFCSIRLRHIGLTGWGGSWAIRWVRSNPPSLRLTLALPKTYPKSPENSISDITDFKLFPGEHAPGPPSLSCLHCSQIQALGNKILDPPQTGPGCPPNWLFLAVSRFFKTQPRWCISVYSVPGHSLQSNTKLTVSLPSYSAALGGIIRRSGGE